MRQTQAVQHCALHIGELFVIHSDIQIAAFAVLPALCGDQVETMKADRRHHIRFNPHFGRAPRGGEIEFHRAMVVADLSRWCGAERDHRAEAVPRPMPGGDDNHGPPLHHFRYFEARIEVADQNGPALRMKP